MTDAVADVVEASESEGGTKQVEKVVKYAHEVVIFCRGLMRQGISMLLTATCAH